MPCCGLGNARGTTWPCNPTGYANDWPLWWLPRFRREAYRLSDQRVKDSEADDDSLSQEIDGEQLVIPLVPGYDGSC